MIITYAISEIIETRLSLRNSNKHKARQKHINNYPHLDFDKRFSAPYNKIMTTGILLAAGLSERFGSPKALAKLNDHCVIEHLQRILIESDVDEIIIVLGGHAEQIKPYILNHKKVRSVYNKDYKLGQTSSVKAGLRAMSNETSAFLLLPVDCPLIDRNLINALIVQFKKESPAILIPSHQGKKGHPPVFSTSLKDKILELDDSVGLNVFQYEHRSETELFTVEDLTFLATFNTPDEFSQIKTLLKSDST